MTYCVVPRDLAHKLHEPLRRHFADDPSIEVIVERRARDRRGDADRRSQEATRAEGRERRKIRNAEGRRVGDRRALSVPVAALELPRQARRHADRLVFVERLRPATEQAEDLDTARLVTRIQAGDNAAFADLYMRYFDRVYHYLRVLLNDAHEAEDATQQVFVKALEALPRYERRSKPFRAWLFTIVRNHAINELKKRSHADVVDPAELDRQREESGEQAHDPAALNAIADHELLMFVERLPLPQRQVIVMRYMLDLSNAQIAAILSRKPDEVKVLHYRAVRFLERRLTAIGRAPRQRDRAGAGRRFKQAPVLRARRFALYR